MLIIFIDALPYHMAANLDSVKSYNKTQLTPGYGYSVNLHAELFAGLQPDNVGYFGEMKLINREIKNNYLMKFIAKLEFKFTGLSRVLRLVLNVLTRRRIGYVPLLFSGMFKKEGKYLLVGETPFENIFDNISFSKHIADKIRAPIGKKDSYVVKEALDAISERKKNIFISMCDLDGMFHEYGEKHTKILEKLAWIDRVLNQLGKKYRSNFPNEPIFIISDHGIADANKHVNINLKIFEKEIFNGDLIVFFDSLYLTFWTKNKNVRNRLEKYLEELPGSLLSNEDREINGIKDLNFGDGIFLLDEGYGFSPNFFGFRKLKAYHGYDPRLFKSKGILISTEKIPHKMRNIEVYDLLKKSIVS